MVDGYVNQQANYSGHDQAGDEELENGGSFSDEEGEHIKGLDLEKDEGTRKYETAY